MSASTRPRKTLPWKKQLAGVDPNTPEAGRADALYGGTLNDAIIGGSGGDILDGWTGDDRLYADTQIDVATAIAQGNAQTGSGLKGDWLGGGAGDDKLRRRTYAATINGRMVANDEKTYAWRAAA